MKSIEVRADIETIRNISSSYISSGDSLGDIFSVRDLGNGWVRLRGEHRDLSLVVMGARVSNIHVRGR